MLRRGYNFTDGNDGLGRLDAGLFFVGLRARPADWLHPDPGRAGADRRAHASTSSHTGSGLYAVPPGVPSIGADGSLVDDAYLGAGLFA